jgi:hypothetical protein
MQLWNFYSFAFPRWFCSLSIVLREDKSDTDVRAALRRCSRHKRQGP